MRRLGELLVTETLPDFLISAALQRTRCCASKHGAFKSCATKRCDWTHLISDEEYKKPDGESNATKLPHPSQHSETFGHRQEMRLR